jgi:chromosome segregation ATPase
MFISTTEKLHINQRLDAQGHGMFEASEKADAALKKAETALESIPNIRATIKTLMDNIWSLDAKIGHLDAKIVAAEERADKKIKEAELRITEASKLMQSLHGDIESLKAKDDMLHRSTKSLFASVASLAQKKTTSRRAKQLVISHESVLALKEAGVWDDATKRIAFIDHLVKDTQEKKAAALKERQREHSRNYYLRKKAERLAKEAA